MSAEVVVTSLTRHLAPRLSAEAAGAAAIGFMRSAAARVGRPIEWDERADAPRLARDVSREAERALLQAAVHLDDAPGADGAWRDLDPARDEAVSAARLRLRRTRFPHLVRADEIFLPTGFDRPIELLKTAIGATVLGSSSRLLAELEQVRDELAHRGGPASASIEAALAPFLELARASVERRLPLIRTARS